MPGRGGPCLPGDLYLVAEVTVMAGTIGQDCLVMHLPHLLFKPNLLLGLQMECGSPNLFVALPGWHIKQISFFCFSVLVSLIGPLRVVTNSGSLGNPGPGFYPHNIPHFLHPPFGHCLPLSCLDSVAMTMGVQICKYFCNPELI